MHSAASAEATVVAPPTPLALRVAHLEDALRLERAEKEAFRAQAQEWRRRAETAEARLAEVEPALAAANRKLAYYEGPNVPTSQANLKAKKPASKGAKKRGAPTGHRGATRAKPRIDAVVDVVAPECPNCRQEPGDPVGVDVHTVTERAEPPPTRTTQYNLAVHECRHCGHRFTARHMDCPQKGVWGPLLLAHFAFLVYFLRGRIRRCVAFLLHQEGLSISVKGYWDALQRVSQACKAEYERIAARVKLAPFRYVDETGAKVQGRKRCLWIVRSNLGDVLVAIRNTRAAKWARELLGDDPGPCVVDGYSGYDFIRTVQRCWQHLLRHVDQWRDASKEGRALSEALWGAFARLKTALATPFILEERERLKRAFELELEGIVQTYQGYAHIQGAVTYLRRGLGKWATCLVVEGMQPTNNSAEQSVREHVLVRRLIGTFRSAEGAENYQYIASVLASWALQGKNPFQELGRLLQAELCRA